MFSNADPVHPKGPEGRPFKERTIEFQGGGHRAVLTLAYPDPDEIVDWVSDGNFDVYGQYRPPLGLNFNFTGHFWQGIFGRVGLDVDLLRNKPGEPDWNSLSDLLVALREKQAHANYLSKGDTSVSRETRLDPVMTELNGIPCIQENIGIGNYPNEKLRYYFLFNKDRAVELVFSLIDNSDRPDLPESDWRQRAEALRSKLLVTVRFHTESDVGSVSH